MLYFRFMRRLLTVLCLLLSGFLSAQTDAPNKTDKEGRRTGEWVICMDADTYFLDTCDARTVSYYKVKFRKGVPVGMTRQYDLQGNLMWEGDCTSVAPDTINGVSRGFYANGNIEFEYFKINNISEGPARAFYENGTTKWACNYRNDMPHGVYTEYYENGVLMREGPVEEGRKNGLFTFYRENGTTQRVRTYTLDETTGHAADYDSLGRMLYSCNMKEGNWHGVMTRYDSTGAEAAYYVFFEDSLQQTKDLIMDISFSIMWQDNEGGLEKSLMLEEYFRKAYGEDSPLYPFAVKSVAQFYFMDGNLDEGPKWALKSFELEKKWKDTEEGASGKEWHLLGLMLETFGMNEKALEAFGYAIGKSYVEGIPTDETIEFLLRAAKLQFTMGRRNEGFGLFRELESNCTSHHGLDTLTCATGLMEYAAYLGYDYLYKDALTVLDAYRELAIGTTLYPSWLAETGNVLMTLNRQEEAMQLYTEVLDLPVVDKESAELHSDVAVELARYYLDAGHIAPAERLYLDARKWSAEFAGEDSSQYYDLTSDLAEFYAKVGRYEQAIQWASGATAYYFRVAGDSLSGLDRLLNAQLAQELAINSALALGRYMEYAGLYRDAEDVYLAVLESAEAMGNDTSLLYATALEAVAGSKMNNREYDTAVDMYRQAIGISSTYWPGINVNLTTWRDNLTECLTRMGRYDEAMALADSVLADRMLEYPEGHPMLGASYKRISYLLEARGAYAEAIALYARYLQQNLDRINSNFSVMNAAEQAAFLRTFRFNFDIFSAMVAKHGDQGGGYERLLDMQLTNRAMLLYSSVAARRSFEKHPDEEVRELYRRWLEEKQLLSAEGLTGRISADSLSRLTAHTDSLEKALNLMAGSEVNFVPSVRTRDLHQALAEGEAFVSFIRYPFFSADTISAWHYLALLLSKESDSLLRFDLGREEELATWLQRKESESSDIDYIDRIYSWPEWEEDTAFYQGDKLYAQTWQPMEKALENTHTVYYSVSGLYHAVNLAAVPVSFNRRMMSNRQMVRLSSPMSLLEGKWSWGPDEEMQAVFLGGVDYQADSETIAGAFKGEGRQEAGPVFVAGHVADGVRGDGWDYLPGTLQEVEQLAPSFETASIASGAAASEEFVKQLQGAACPGIWHIATHGFFNKGEEGSDAMFNSGLVLAGGGRTDRSEGEDGILTAAEISYLDMSGAELVVLSACQTGLGSIHDNEGVFGLQRGFTLAGAEHLVMSLWKVGDRETALFMQYLYKHLDDGLALQDAFNKAQTTMSQRYGPYYWAAFVLQH